MSLCTLRVRGPSGSSTIQLAPTATLLELRAAIFSSTNIPPDRQQLRVGVPPRPIPSDVSDDAVITDAGLRTGDMIIVQEGDPGAVSANTVLAETTQQNKPSPVSSSTHPSSTSSSTSKPAPALSAVRPSQTTASNQKVIHDLNASDSVPKSLSDPRPQGRDAPPARNVRPQQPLEPQSAAIFSGSGSSGAKPGFNSIENANVRVDGGWMVLRVVPDDNSCMFTALGITLEHDASGSAQKLREEVAKAILGNPFDYSEAVLGMEPSKYCDKIRKATTWGGAIELKVISDLYKIEIDSIDVQTGRVDRFGEEKGYEQHILLIYSGIHYDAITFTPMEPDPASNYPYDLGFDQTQFNKIDDGYAMAAAKELSHKLKLKHYYTDTAGFALRCEICKKALKGEKEAEKHAKETGHTSFGEY